MFMDYEKAYKEALEPARAGKPMNEVFPEIHESEDERIRKDLICEVQSWDGIPQSKREKYVAWLERQKEKKVEKWSGDDETRLKVIKEELERFIMFNQYGTSLSVDDVEWLKFLPERFNLQPKQEWSEDEEKDIQEASDYLRDYANSYVQGGNSKLYVQSLADKIESLRPQPHWKPSADQIDALDEYIWVKEPNKDKAKYVISLYHDLKKL